MSLFSIIFNHGKHGFAGSVCQNTGAQMRGEARRLYMTQGASPLRDPLLYKSFLAFPRHGEDRGTAGEKWFNTLGVYRATRLCRLYSENKVYYLPVVYSSPVSLSSLCLRKANKPPPCPPCLKGSLRGDAARSALTYPLSYKKISVPLCFDIPRRHNHSLR